MALPVDTCAVRLPLMLLPHDVVDRVAAIGQVLMEPMPANRQVVPLVAKSLVEMGHERSRERQKALRPLGQQARRIVGALLDNFVGPGFAAAAVVVRFDDRIGQPPQIFDQSQAEHDRHRPNLAHAERRDLLIGFDEPSERGFIERAIGMGDDLQRQGIHARIAGQCAAGQLRQLVIEAPRQVFANFAQLLAHDIEIIQQPLCPRRDLFAGTDRGDDLFVCFFERIAIRVETIPKLRFLGMRRDDRMPGRQGAGVRLEMLHAERSFLQRNRRIQQKERDGFRGTFSGGFGCCRW